MPSFIERPGFTYTTLRYAVPMHMYTCIRCKHSSGARSTRAMASRWAYYHRRVRCALEFFYLQDQ